MIDPITFAAAFNLVMLIHIVCRKRRKRARIPEFDGGFRMNNPPRVTTIIYSKDVHHQETPTNWSK